MLIQVHPGTLQYRKFDATSAADFKLLPRCICRKSKEKLDFERPQNGHFGPWNLKSALNKLLRIQGREDQRGPKEKEGSGQQPGTLISELWKLGFFAKKPARPRSCRCGPCPGSGPSARSQPDPKTKMGNLAILRYLMLLPSSVDPSKGTRFFKQHECQEGGHL